MSPRGLKLQLCGSGLRGVERPGERLYRKMCNSVIRRSLVWRARQLIVRSRYLDGKIWRKLRTASQGLESRAADAASRLPGGGGSSLIPDRARRGEQKHAGRCPRPIWHETCMHGRCTATEREFLVQIHVCVNMSSPWIWKGVSAIS